MAKRLPILPLEILDGLESKIDLLRPTGRDLAGDTALALGLLLELIEAGERGYVSDPAAVSYLRDGATNYLTGKTESLEEALGLPRKYRQENRREFQHFYLREAWGHLEESWPGPTARAKALADEIQRLEMHWSEYSALKEPDSDWTRVRQALFWARQFGPLPQQRQLLRIAMSKFGFVS